MDVNARYAHFILKLSVARKQFESFQGRYKWSISLTWVNNICLYVQISDFVVLKASQDKCFNTANILNG